MSPTPPLRIALALAGLAAVGASLWVAFNDPYTLWPWLLLLVALACAWGSRQVK